MMTLVEKIWDKHIVKQIDEKDSVLYIDRHFIHEVTSPQAFNVLKEKSVPVFRVDQTTATVDHNIPTLLQEFPIEQTESRIQVEELRKNCIEFGIPLYDIGNEKQGIVHVIGPELGLTIPGSTIVCGDSHTSTHGAFGAIAFGIGTSEVATVLATQCVIQSIPKTMKIEVTGKLSPFVTSKDVILYIISKLGTAGATEYFVEFSGDTFENMTMEGRMTVCNMSIEMGARGGLIAPDQVTFDYLLNTKYWRENHEKFEMELAYWKTLKTDEGAKYDKVVSFNASDITQIITYGTNPGTGISIDSIIPTDEGGLEYMEFEKGQTLEGTEVDYVFLGSCTNGRIEDLRLFSELVKGHQKADNITAWIVPGSKLVENQCIDEGIDLVLKEAGFELRQPGCSACLAMNPDKVPAGKLCVSTSNRNFEGRQGVGARTILASPVTAAIVAVTGKIISFKEFEKLGYGKN